MSNLGQRSAFCCSGRVVHVSDSHVPMGISRAGTRPAGDWRWFQVPARNHSQNSGNLTAMWDSQISGFTYFVGGRARNARPSVLVQSNHRNRYGTLTGSGLPPGCQSSVQIGFSSQPATGCWKPRKRAVTGPDFALKCRPDETLRVLGSKIVANAQQSVVTAD